MRAAPGKGRSTRRARRPSVSGDAAIVEGRPDLRITPENEEAVVEILAEILLDALAREERGARPVEAMRQALAGAELALDAPFTPAAAARIDRPQVVRDVARAWP
jgi:hypothetical protein